MLEKLLALNGKIITIVRPYFGSQSESFKGEFSVIQIGTDYKFHLSTAGISLIFRIEDVKSVDNLTIINEIVLRLKGPKDYRDWYE